MALLSPIQLEILQALEKHPEGLTAHAIARFCNRSWRPAASLRSLVNSGSAEKLDDLNGLPLEPPRWKITNQGRAALREEGLIR